MKVLFICNVSITEGVLSCAPWIKSLIAGLDRDIRIAVLSEGASDGTITSDGRSLVIYGYASGDVNAGAARALDSFCPDAVVIFGTERPYTLGALKSCISRGMAEHTALYAQGIALACAESYCEGVPAKVISRYTLRDVLRRQNIKSEQKLMFARARDEAEAMRMTRSFIGRTTMDRAVLGMYDPGASYYRCGDVLRDCFYDGCWSYDSCEKGRIFISQFYYPLKGFHYLLEAVSYIKSKYPDIRIAAAGYNPIAKSLTERELKDSSYIRYIKSLIKRFDLSDNIELLGSLSADEMKREYLRANVFVLPSSIENSPNSMAEAMMLGVPTVAADVGGVSDFAVHREEAYLYPSSAPYLLAHYLDALLSDPKGAQAMGAAGRARAMREYDRDENIKTFEAALRCIAGKE